MSLNQGELEPFQQNFTKGVDTWVSIAGEDSFLSSPSTSLEHMYIRLVGYQDGHLERFLSTFSHPSISYGASTYLPNEAQVVYFQGQASAEVYLNALHSISYTNARSIPTPGRRLVLVSVYDGISTNALALNASAFSVLTVLIDNVRPQVTVSGGDNSYNSRHFPFKGPTPAVNPLEALVIDADSKTLQSAVLQLGNVRNLQNEILSVTYISPEQLSPPVVAEALDLEIPFGNLSARGELVPSITSPVVVSRVGVVGSVDVIVDIRHSWVGDLKLELEHDGRRETLVMNPGGRFVIMMTSPALSLVTTALQPRAFIYPSPPHCLPDSAPSRRRACSVQTGVLGISRGDGIEGGVVSPCHRPPVGERQREIGQLGSCDSA